MQCVATVCLSLSLLLFCVCFFMLLYLIEKNGEMDERQVKAKVHRSFEYKCAWSSVKVITFPVLFRYDLQIEIVRI